MAKEIKLWEITGIGKDSQQKEIPSGRLSSLSAGKRVEDDLRDWILQTPAIISEDLVIIGKEIENIDVLGFNSEGRIVIIETKRDEPREAVQQAIDYASLVTEKNIVWLVGKAKEKKFPIRDYEHFEEINLENPKIYVVGTVPDDKTERMVRFLSQREVDIDLVIIRYHRDVTTGREFITRTHFLTEEIKRELRETEQRKRYTWDENSYFEKMNELHSSEVVATIRYFFDLVKRTPALHLRFGFGKKPGIMIDSDRVKTLVYFYADGDLAIWDYPYIGFNQDTMNRFYEKLHSLGFVKMTGYYRRKIEETPGETLEALLAIIVSLITDKL